jgi:DHA1 family multidrug resistance protein-like MFS transporter
MHDWNRSYKAIWIAEFIAIAGFATTTPIVPLYFRELGMTDTASLNFWTGLTHTGASLAMAFFAPIWGSLADSYGRKLMLLRAMFGGALLIGLMALATEPWQVAVLRTIQGALTGTVAAANVLTASLVPTAQLGYRLGLMQMAIYLGNSIGPLFGGVVGDAFGYRYNFLATGLILSSAGFIILGFVREDFTPKPRSGSILRNAIPDLSPLKQVPVLASLMGVLFLVQFANSVTVPMLPLFIVQLSANAQAVGSMSGLIIAASSMSGALAAGLIGKVSGKVGYAKTLLFCLGGAFLFYLPQGLIQAPWQLLVLRMGSGAFLGGTMPSVNALIATSCAKDRQGATFGLSSSISSMGMAIGPAVGAVVATAAGYRSVFFVTTLALGLVGVLIGKNIRRPGPGGVASVASGPGTARLEAAEPGTARSDQT